MKLHKLVAILETLDGLADNSEVRVYLNDKPPLDIDHLEIMLDSEGNVTFPRFGWR
jgi:hypothetical protein